MKDLSDVRYQDLRRSTEELHYPPAEISELLAELDSYWANMKAADPNDEAVFQAIEDAHYQEFLRITRNPLYGMSEQEIQERAHKGDFPI